MSRAEALLAALVIFAMANLFLITLVRGYRRRDQIVRSFRMWRLERQSPWRRR